MLTLLIDALLLKFAALSWLDAIKASAILASLVNLIDLAFKLLFGK